MDYRITSAGGRSSQTTLGEHTIRFNVPNASGDGTSPGPLGVFAAAAGACAWFFASGVLVEAGVSTDDLAVDVHTDMASEGPSRIEAMRIVVTLPEGLDGAVVDAARAAVGRCPVKGTLSQPPTLEVVVG